MFVKDVSSDGVRRLELWGSVEALSSWSWPHADLGHLEGIRGTSAGPPVDALPPYRASLCPQPQIPSVKVDVPTATEPPATCQRVRTTDSCANNLVRSFQPLFEGIKMAAILTVDLMVETITLEYSKSLYLNRCERSLCFGCYRYFCL